MADDTDPPEETLEELPADPPDDDPPPDENLNARIEGLSKGLQRVTQELSQLNRNAAKQGGELDEVQEAKRKQAHAEALRLRTELEQYAAAGASGEEGIDQKLTKKILELDQRQNQLEAENDRLRSQLQASAPSPDEQWAKWEAKYQGADVKTLWKEALKSAGNSFAVKNAAAQLAAGKIDQESYDAIFEGAASDIFHPRATAAAKPKAPTASAPPPPPPNGGRTVPMRGGSPPAPNPQHDPLTDLIFRESAKMDRKR